MSGFEPRLHDEIAEAERWLDGFAAPRFPAELANRTKAAVRSELAARASNQGRRWNARYGAMAAAAMIALALLTGYYSTKSTTGPLASVEPADAEPALVVLESIVNDGLATDTLDDFVDWSAEESYVLSGASLLDALESIVSEDRADDASDTGASLPPKSGRNTTGDVS